MWTTSTSEADKEQVDEPPAKMKNDQMCIKNKPNK